MNRMVPNIEHGDEVVMMGVPGWQGKVIGKAITMSGLQLFLCERTEASLEAKYFVGTRHTLAVIKSALSA